MRLPGHGGIWYCASALSNEKLPFSTKVESLFPRKPSMVETRGGQLPRVAPVKNAFAFPRLSFLTHQQVKIRATQRGMLEEVWGPGHKNLISCPPFLTHSMSLSSCSQPSFEPQPQEVSPQILCRAEPLKCNPSPPASRVPPNTRLWGGILQSSATPRNFRTSAQSGLSVGQI